MSRGFGHTLYLDIEGCTEHFKSFITGYKKGSIPGKEHNVQEIAPQFWISLVSPERSHNSRPPADRLSPHNVIRNMILGGIQIGCPHGREEGVHGKADVVREFASIF